MLPLRPIRKERVYQDLWPSRPVARGETPGILTAARGLQKNTEFVGKLSQILDQVASHLDDFRYVFDKNRTYRHAGPAGRARPRGVLSHRSFGGAVFLHDKRHEPV